ncbi:MAG: TolC family protein [Bacteroidales bacterium]|nr:TolC family protein [Bacteroidales bacterium]
MTKSFGIFFMIQQFILILFNNTVYCQTFEISLSKILAEYCFVSPEAIKAKLNYENANYSYENYKKRFLPSVAFNLNPANFNHSFKVLQNPSDGSYSYVDDFSNNSSIGVSVSQIVGITGGSINMNSNLNMLNELNDNRKSFSTSPFSIGYSQKLFGGTTKDFKLSRSIEQKKNVKAAKDYCSSITGIQREAVKLFMDLILVKVSMDIASKNEAISDTLLQASTVMYDNGRMAENEYLQMKIQAINDHFASENYKKEYEISLRRLLDYFGMTDNYENYMIGHPEFNLPFFLDFSIVMEYVEKNNPFALEQQIKRIEAERNIHNAKHQNRFTSNISFNFGTNQYASIFRDAYKNMASQQSLTIGLQIPVLQWGINKNHFKIAQNNYEISMMEIEREYVRSYNDLKEQVNNYNHNVNLMTIARSSFELAIKQYEVSVNKFNLGKLSIYELGVAQKEVFTSMNRYYATMKEVWDGYYSLRNLTLFDFVENKELTETLLH